MKYITLHSLIYPIHYISAIIFFMTKSITIGKTLHICSALANSNMICTSTNDVSKFANDGSLKKPVRGLI